MNTHHIRPASPEDLPAIAEIYADAVANGTATYELEPPSAEEMLERFMSVTAGGYPYFVAMQDDRLLGYAYASAFRPRPAYRFIVENSVYVTPAAKGRGVGKALMLALIAECEQLGFRQILAVIGDGSPTSPSVWLHQALGFRHAGTLEATGWKHGRWLDTALMQLSLNGGGTGEPDPGSLPERMYQAQGRSD